MLNVAEVSLFTATRIEIDTEWTFLEFSILFKDKFQNLRLGLEGSS